MGSAIKSLGTKTGNVFSVVHHDVYRHLLQFPLLGYSLFAAKKVPVRAAKQDGFPPVILVHGLGGSRGDLLPMECYLRLHGRKRIYRIGLHGKNSVREMSRQLARFIRRVVKVNESPKVDIVAYSLGGIVSRLAILDHGLEEVVRSLVTMGTPHNGTMPARYANTVLTRSLCPGSPVMKKLKNSPWPKGVRGVSFWSKNDILVHPPETAAAEGTSQIDMSPFTHFSYLIDPRSWAAVQTALLAG